MCACFVGAVFVVVVFQVSKVFCGGFNRCCLSSGVVPVLLNVIFLVSKMVFVVSIQGVCYLLVDIPCFQEACVSCV